MGRVIALALARHGWDVAVHCHRSRAEADAVAAEITAMGRRAAVLQADLSDEVAAGRLIGDCIAALGTPTCLVNNASLFEVDVIVDDLHDPVQTAWPQFVEQALRVGFSSVVAVPLISRGRVWGALDLYRRRAGTWQTQELVGARLLAQWA